MAGFYYAYHLFPDKSIINGDIPIQKSPNVGRFGMQIFFGHLQRN